METWLKEVVERLVSELRPIAVILFGSRARGDWKPWSDYDLLIVAEFKERYMDRFLKIYDIVGNRPIEPHPYTLEEALKMLERGNPMLVDAMEEGIVLYEGEGFRKLKDLYERLKEKGLSKSDTSVILPS